ncbi:MAG TPA: hypothetical protein VKN99_17795 [Polyangia bacterium]|nr:hypothetical protein [Polyangia bacterium]
MSRHNVILVVIALGTAASFAIVQGMFDRADHEKAERLVRTFAGRQGTLEDLLARRDPGAHMAANWSSEILSGCRGFVRVKCQLPAAGGEYAFDVDLVRKAIHPGNQRGQAALEELAGPTAPTTPSAPTAPTAPH